VKEIRKGASSKIQLFSGRVVDPLRPDPAWIDPVDIAHSLGQLARYTGHMCEFYSVGEHSVHVSQACDPEDALWGLLHDASEAYLGDMSTPLKHEPTFSDAYRVAESRLMAAICERFGLPPYQPASVSRADRAMLERERLAGLPETDEATLLWEQWTGDVDTSWLPKHCAPQWWNPGVTEAIFIGRLRELEAGR